MKLDKQTFEAIIADLEEKMELFKSSDSDASSIDKNRDLFGRTLARSSAPGPGPIAYFQELNGGIWSERIPPYCLGFNAGFEAAINQIKRRKKLFIGD